MRTVDGQRSCSSPAPIEFAAAIGITTSTKTATTTNLWPQRHLGWPQASSDRRVRPSPHLSLRFVSQCVISVLLVVLNLVSKCQSAELSQKAKFSATGSEWNFDNQALRSISSQILCSQNTMPQQANGTTTKEATRQFAQQQVNVVTFIGNQIDSIEPNAFKCVASELRILVLTSNELNRIHVAAFEGLHSVQVLLLDNNLLTSIPSELALSGLKSLRHLNLADNKIEELARAAFGPHLSGLISLNLAGNPLLQVHPSSLVNLIKLKTLTLSRSSNRSFADWPLEGLRELRFLHLDRSKRGEGVRLGVTKDLCLESPKLSSLILKSNAIERVPQFAHCRNLLLLDLSYNNIRGALSENFTQQTNLIDLYLGNNLIEHLTERALIGLNKLQVLELQNNLLKRIDQLAFLPVQPALVELNLSHNPELSELSSQHLRQLRSLKCYGNERLRSLPHFESASQLALTFAHHCCDYPWLLAPAASAQMSGRPTTTQDGAAAQRRPQEEDSLIVRLLLGDEAEQQTTNQGSSLHQDQGDLASELILWPPPPTTTATTAAVTAKTETNNIRRSRGAALMMDDDAGDFLTELKLIRRQHSVELISMSWEQPIVGAGSLSAPTTTTTLNRTARSALAAGQPAGRCRPSPGPFLPCNDLFDGWWLRLGIWSAFLLAFLGNTLVIIVLSSVRQTSSSSALTSIMWLAHSKRHIDVPRFLVINLAIADLLMALYLGLLAFVDLSSLGEFKRHAIRWQHSAGCQLAGFLAVLGSELSVFILAIITLERNYAITNAVHLNRRLSLQKAMLIMFLGYAFALAMAIMPLYGISDYRRVSVCLPLDVESSPGSQLYVITLIGINTFSFALLLGCYLRMYFAIRGSQAWNANDLRIAKRMSILVLTDFLCWMPIIASGLTSLFGYHLIGSEGMKVMTIFVLPLNSVANPFLYAITTKKFKRDLAILRRRTRALLRLECIISPTDDEAHHHHHHHSNAPGAYPTGAAYKQARLHCGHPVVGLLAHTNNNNNNNNSKNSPNLHYRHDLLLLTSHQAHKGANARKAKTRLAADQRPAPRLAAARQTDNRSPRPGACAGCSCQQRRQPTNLDQPQQQQQQQQTQVRPRIVLETATQTSRHHHHLLAQSQVLLLRKSRSTNSGLTIMAMRLDEQPTPARGKGWWPFAGEAATDADHSGDRPRVCAESPRAGSGGGGGPLTKVEESMLASGNHDDDDELSLHWNDQPRPRSFASEASGEDPDRKRPSPANSLSVEQQQPSAANGRASNHRRAVGSRFYLSVDPFQTAAATAAPTAGGNNIRSASACGQLAGCRAIEAGAATPRTTTLYDKCQMSGSHNKPPRGPVSGSCDTVRVSSGGGGGPIKLSRSIQRLLFGPLAKAWSSIQISLNSSAATHVGQQQHQYQYHIKADDDDDDGDRSLEQVDRMLDEGIDAEAPMPMDEGDYLDDDILIMSSPLKRSMRIGERKMSRSCDAIQQPKSGRNNGADLLQQFNSPSHSISGQEQSSSQCYDDDDQRVLLATINRLAAGSQRTRLAAGNGGRLGAAGAISPALNHVGQARQQNQPGKKLAVRARCTRCRSWSPALLTKLENCIYQMKSKISSGFVSQNAGATRLESSHQMPSSSLACNSAAGSAANRQSPARLDHPIGDSCVPADEASSESELELEAAHGRDGDGDGAEDEDEGDIYQEGDGLSLDDQFGGLPTDWAPRRHTTSKSGRVGRMGRLRHQSSVNSDTLSTRTAGTLITNMSLSSDSNASIQLAVAAAASATNHQPTRLDIITDTQDDDHDDDYEYEDDHDEDDL